MTLFLIGSDFSLAMGFGLVCLLVAFRDASARVNDFGTLPLAIY